MDAEERLLAEVAVRGGLLTESQVEEFRREAQARGLAGFADAARAAGALSPADHEALYEQLGAALFDLAAPAAPRQERVDPAPPPGAQPGREPTAVEPGALAPAPAAGAAAPAGAEGAGGGAIATPGTSELGPRAEVAARDVGDPRLEDGGRGAYLVRALRFAAQNGANDLHVHTGLPLLARQHGKLLPFQGGRPLDAAAMEKVIAQLLTDAQWAVLGELGEVDFAYAIPGVGRFRVNAYRQHRGLDIVFRILPPTPPTLAELGLPASLERLVDYRTGLVLATGPSGCGKTTTLAALLNVIVQGKRDHVLTLENPIEFVYPPGKAVVTQRDVGRHTASFARGLRAALREDPDVVAITELRDRDSIGLALTAAETGHLVLGTLHTGSAAQTVGRLIHAFPADEQAQVRSTVAESLRAVVSQRLVPRADGPGRVLALELLIVTPAVSNLIREEKEFQLGMLMQTGKGQGMLTLDDSLADLVARGSIDRNQARRFADNRERFR